MTKPKFKNLQNSVGLSDEDYLRFAGIDDINEIDLLRNASHPRQQALMNQLAILDAKIETAVINEIDLYSRRAERDTVLIRFLTDDDFALYEPDLYENLGGAMVHGNFITRLKQAIERLGGRADIAFMDSAFYEAWLGVNDFDDSRDLRLAWARQQMRGLDK